MPASIVAYSVAGMVLAGMSYFGASLSQDDLPVIEMADRYCIAPDGDHRMTWHLADRDGFSPLSPDQFSKARTPGVINTTLRGFGKNLENREIRVLTAASWIRSGDQGLSHYRWCWVSSSDEDIGDVDHQMRRLIGSRGFRAAQSRVFAWIPRPDGSLEPVSRRVFMRSGWALAREQGLRHITTRRFGNGVFIGYASPRDEATYRDFDWSGPEPVPAPR